MLPLGAGPCELCRPGDPMDCSPPGSSVRGIAQARMLQWGAVCSSIVSPQLKWDVINIGKVIF